jgi:hypothetical protein
MCDNDTDSTSVQSSAHINEISRTLLIDFSDEASQLASCSKPDDSVDIPTIDTNCQQMVLSLAHDSLQPIKHETPWSWQSAANIVKSASTPPSATTTVPLSSLPYSVQSTPVVVVPDEICFNAEATTIIDDVQPSPFTSTADDPGSDEDGKHHHRIRELEEQLERLKIAKHSQSTRNDQLAVDERLLHLEESMRGLGGGSRPMEDPVDVRRHTHRVQENQDQTDRHRLKQLRAKQPSTAKSDRTLPSSAMTVLRPEVSSSPTTTMDPNMMESSLRNVLLQVLDEARGSNGYRHANGNLLDTMQAPLRFKDAVGRKFSFPWHLVKTWKVPNSQENAMRLSD